jgi:hypothetical protein
LNAAAERRLLAMVGYDCDRAFHGPTSWILRMNFRSEVERSLGVAAYGKARLDNAPRPSDYLAQVKDACREAMRLYERLDSWSRTLDDALYAHGSDIVELQGRLQYLVDACIATEEQYRGQSSRGRPKKAALMEAIRGLRETFRSHYKGARGTRTQRGAFQIPAEWEKRELEFVRVALLSEPGFVSGQYAEDELPRVFRNPLTQP